MNKEKENFESYAKKHLGFRKNQFSKYIDGSYKNEQLRVYSEIWEASAWQAKAQAVPEGFVLVPREPTEEMIQAGRDERRDLGTVASTYKAMIEAQEKTND